MRERPNPQSTRTAATESSPVFRLRSAKSGVDAAAQVNGEEFTVLKDSLVVGDWSATGRAPSTRRAYDSYRALYGKLLADGSIVAEAGQGRLTFDKLRVLWSINRGL